MGQFSLDDLRMLLALQELDSQLDAGRVAMQAAAERTSAREARALLATAAEQSSAAEARLSGLRRDVRYQEQELAALEAEIAAQDKKLYGGTIRNPKEAAQLQHHVASLRKHASEMSDRAVESLIVVEEYEPQVRQAADAAMSLRAEVERLEALDQATEARLAGELPELSLKRDALAARVPPVLLREYEVLRARRGGIAVTAVVDGRCARCRMVIPYITVREVRSGELRTCDTCGRIVVEPA